MTVKSLSRSKPVSFPINPPPRKTTCCCTDAFQRAVVVSLMIVLTCIFFLIVATPLAAMIEEKIAQSSTPAVAKYNLMSENTVNATVTNCTLESINVNKLQQDHRCVISVIKHDFLQRPTSSNVYLNPHNAEDLMSAQSIAILRLLRNQTRGYFVEYNLRERSVLSNTLYMERSLNWSGLLIEADPIGYNKRLVSRNTKTSIAHACLSLNPFSYNQMSLLMQSRKETHDHGFFNEDLQCFPLYSMLVASNRTSVDFLSLNAEGHEMKILKTIPFKNVNIKTLAINCDQIPEGEQALVKYLEINGFVKIGQISLGHVNDWIFIKDVLQDLREAARHLL